MRAVLTDVEGTTTSLSLVRDVLFPYSRRHLGAFVRRSRGVPEVDRAMGEVRALEGKPDLDDEGVIEVLNRWADEDRKATPLKTLQGLVWADGYGTGELLGHVYEDAVARLRAWRAEGIALHVYSSGSVAAQKLLFAHTPWGDLTPLFSGHFDTTVGSKLQASSYAAIAHAAGAPAGEILFLSDHVGELDAAREAGLVTIWVDREGVPRAPAAHRRVASFAEI